MENVSIIQTMAKYVAETNFDKIPTSVVQKLKVCICDALECCLSRMEDDRSKAAFNSVLKNQAGAKATLFATNEKASAEDAAFYNTVKGALTSRNDSSRTAICHPGSILIPVVFALAEERNASGKRILESILVGYETMIRLGNTLVASKINGSWRNTALVAPFGAAFSAAKIMGINEKEIASAASFSCHFAGGVNEWAVAGTGEDVFQNGWGARNGILAMRLARAGAKGCATVLEGKSGLLSALDAQKTNQMLTEQLGVDYKILGIMHKPMDCCFMVQGPSQAAKKLVDEQAIVREELDRIDHIDIYVAAQAKNYPGCDNNKTIESLVQGIMSIQLGVASTIINGDTNQISWNPPIDARIQNLMGKCYLHEDSEMTCQFPHKQGARIVATMMDGATYCVRHEDVVPLTERQVIDRFLCTATDRLGEENATNLYQLIINIEKEPDIHRITALLS